jgi:hypothetical protein
MGQKKSATGPFVGLVAEEVGKSGPEQAPAYGIDAIANARALHGALNQSGIFQFLQVLRNGGLRQAQFIHQIAANARIGGHQVLQYRYSCRVGNRLGHCGQGILPVCK